VKLAAFDVDLDRVHGYSAVNGRLCYNAQEWPYEKILEHDRVLVEIASPVDTSRKNAERYNRRKWSIGNALMIGRMMFWAEVEGIIDRILVSPSNRWTCGYEERVREVMAGCVGQDNHDIRACRSMLYFYQERPDRWQPIRDYYRALSKRKR